MRQTLLIFVFLVQMVIASFSALAQSNYPIFVSPSLLPPYSLQLSDYSAHGSQRLMVTIVVNDLEVANLPVKLRLMMETAGATIETPVTLNTTPIYLDGGSATVLFGEDLYDYFNLNNLQFKGFSKEAYQRSGQMPEGFYRFSIEVLHFHTNRVISNTGTTSAWMALGHPPVLRLPANDAELGQYVGVPITFSWLSSNVGSPVSAGSIRYKFELWEVRVKGVNPYNIVGSMPVFYEHVTSTNSYSFNPASVMMEEGMTYAWRVTAFDESGLVPFAQNGQSEVRTFTYKSRCEAVSDITATAGGQKGSFVWTPEKNHTSFNVEVRNADTDWFSASETYDSKVEFFQLERGQTYELRVQAVCNGDAASVSDYSSWTSLLIPDKKPDESNDDCPDCACSDDLPDVELTNFELRHDLTVGDTLTNKTGTTRFIVREVNPQGNGIYSGIFYFWGELWGMKVPCEFSDLQVNTDNVIVNMDYKSINDPKFLVDVDVLVEKGNDFLDQLATVTAKTRIVDTISVQQEFDYVVVKDGELYAVVVEQDTVVERPMGVSLEEAKQKLITSADGGEVVISSKGEPMGVQEFKATGGNNRLVKSYNEQKEREQLTEGSMIGFSAYDKQNYGFDAYDPLKQKIQHFYPSMANGYQPAFKSVESFRYDKVLTDAPSGISFRDEMGIPALSVNGSLNIQGHVAGSNRALYAYRALSDSTEEVVGKLNVVSFDIATKRVHIVPVNGAKMPTQSQLEHTLKQVYKQAIATWTVVPEPGVLLDFPGGRMTHEGSGSFSTYNKDQTSTIEAYEATGRKLERGDLYLFFVDGATFKDRSLAGYMPLNRQVGFIYDNPSPIIVAHELGHGAFNLRHTFSPEALIANEFDTQNLMDYNGGSELWQHQWDLIHNPESILFSWAQDEEEGAMTFNDERDKLLGLMNTIGRDAFLFLKKCDIIELPDKMVFKLGGNYYRGVVGKYTSTGSINILDGIIPKQEVEKKYTNIEIPVDKEEFIILGKGDEAVICETYEDYSEFCTIKDNSKSDDFLAKWTKDISKCVTNNLKQEYDTEIAIGDMSDGELVQIANDLKELLSIAYFNNIKIGINIRTSNGESSTLSNTANPEEVEIQLDYYIDYINNQILVKETVKDKFYESSKLASSLRETAGKKNIPIDELREDALRAFRALKDERIDYGEGFSAKIREFFTSHAKAIQITGKVGKNIWEESTIPNGVWYSQGEGREYYEGSFEVPNIPSGVVDGIIGEVLSMPIMIKTAGEIVLNKEKAQAFGAIFTSDGFTKMLKGIKDDFVESMQDEEKRPYTISKTTVEVASMFLGTGWVKGANKAGKEVAGETVEALQKIPGGVKIAEGIPASKIKRLTEQLQKLTEKADFDKIADRIGDFSEATRLKFVDDLVSDPNFYKKIIDNPEIIDLFQLHKKIDDILPSEFERLREIADKLDDDLVNKWASYGDEMNTLLKRFKKAGLIEEEALEILSKNYDNFVQQVTIDVILPAGTKVPDGVKSLKILADGRKQITTIVDGVGKKGDELFFHEVKASSKIIDNADELLTTQQKFFKEVLEGKVSGELVPRGPNANRIFGETGKNIVDSPKIIKKLNIEVKDLPLN